MKHDNATDPDARPRDRRRILQAALALPAAGFLAACELTVPGQGPPPTLYRLTPKSSFRDDLPLVSWQLVLEPPLANAGLNTTRISLQRAPTLFEYYARSNWADRAPLMVLTLMIESFENSRRIVAVGREAVGLRADFVLKTELREFQAEYFEGEVPKVRVAITAKLVQMPKRAIIGSQSFDHSVAAEADRMDAIVKAFDAALGKVLRRLVEWTLITGQAAATA
ncbi:MAG: ABC-type transport auxiliary lipoprotein family protein [Kiloniellaceae bacterium]